MRHKTPQPAQDAGFEALLADVGAGFVNLVADQVDQEIEDALRRISEHLGLDTASLWQWSAENPRSLTLTHLYQALHGVPIPRQMDADESFPWCQDEIMSGRTIVISSLSEAPAAAARDLESWRRFGIRAVLSMPLSVGGGVPFGVLNFCDRQHERMWTALLVTRLQLSCQIFANALARKQMERELRHNEAQLRLAADSAEVGLWSLDLATRNYWLTAKTRELFGFPATEVVTLERFLGLVHPDDRDLVQDTIRRVVQSNQEGHVHYRVVRPDGALRWFSSRGRVHCSAAGEPTCLMGVSQDITERREAEQRHCEREAHLAVAVDVAGLGFYQMADSQRITFMDERGQALVGAPAGDLQQVRDYWLAHIHAEDRQRVLQVSQEMLEQGANQRTVEYRYEHPQRGQIWLQHQSRVLARDAAGQATSLVGVLHDVTQKREVEESLRQALAEVQRLRDRLEAENVYLRQEVTVLHGHSRIVAGSPAMRQVMNQIEQVAATDATVLLLGETGTGKELLAAALHDLSPRRGRAMVSVNCAAMPPALIESELFGREKGAYTGALSRQMGRFELANGSTLFLDEIGDMPLEVQAKLLRVLQEKRFERLGSPQSISVDVRIVAATNHDLEKAVRAGLFRQDLFYRLNVFPIRVPPLREHLEDLQPLVAAFVEEFSEAMGKDIESISQASLSGLARYAWPGNVRELRNLVERAMITARGPTLSISPPDAVPVSGSTSLAMRDVEAAHIRSVLEQTGWRVRGKNGAAELLQLKPSTLESRMLKLGIRRPGR